MSSVCVSRQKLLGLLELDAAGTVLYFRTERSADANGERGETPLDITGRNFFGEVAPFRNVEDFHHRLDSFYKSSDQANSFEFDCDYEGQTVPVRVLLARICERSESRATKSMLVHIREIA